MSFSPFKEVDINNPGTSTVYGSDDLLYIMRMFNGTVVSNRRIDMKTPWRWLDNFDVVAASVVPASPGSNTKRFYVDPADNHFKMKSSSGGILDFDVIGQSSTGEVNTASNVGVGGVGPFKQKTSSNLEFKNINAGSTKVTVTNDTTNSEVDIDVSEANLTLNNVGGILGVTKGGLGTTTLAANGLIRGNGTSTVNVIAPGTNGFILTMVSGVPTWAAAGASADTKVVLFEAATQVGTIGRRLNLAVDDDFTIAEDVANDRFNVSLTRSEYEVARWFTPSGLTKTNLGTTYADLFPTSGGEGNGTDIDSTGKNDYRFYVSWNKNAGSGTHSIQIVSQSTSDVLATISNASTGRNVTTGTIPAGYFTNQIRSIKLQAKSTVSTDDPIFYGAALYFK